MKLKKAAFIQSEQMMYEGPCVFGESSGYYTLADIRISSAVTQFWFWKNHFSFLKRKEFYSLLEARTSVGESSMGKRVAVSAAASVETATPTTEVAVVGRFHVTSAATCELTR